MPDFLLQFSRTVDRLNGQGYKVFFTAPMPEYAMEAPRLIAMLRLRGAAWEKAETYRRGTDFARRLKVQLQGIADDHDAVVIDPSVHLCAGEACRIQIEGASLYIDDNHLSPAGSRLVAPAFHPLFDFVKRN